MSRDYLEECPCGSGKGASAVYCATSRTGRLNLSVQQYDARGLFLCYASLPRLSEVVK
jgi:hypothetical protein